MIQILLDHFFCQVTFGINWRAININVNEKEGIISESDQYYYLYGINFDYHF